MLNQIKTQLKKEYLFLIEEMPENYSYRYEMGSNEMNTIHSQLSRLTNLLLDYLHLKFLKGCLKDSSHENLRDVFCEEMIIGINNWHHIKVAQTPIDTFSENKTLTSKLLYFAVVDIILLYVTECRKHKYYMFSSRFSFWLWAKKTKELYFLRKLLAVRRKNEVGFAKSETFYLKIIKEFKLFNKNRD